jgi:hypothetical protein
LNLVCQRFHLHFAGRARMLGFVFSEIVQVEACSWITMRLRV